MPSDTIEETETFRPKFNTDGLIPCITTDSVTGEVLMLAYMNEEALQKSLETGEVHYWSRSREEIWHKGATSGNTQKITEIKIDCDQDCILIRAEMPLDENGKISACHTGRESCFYRNMVLENGAIKLINCD